MKKFASFLITTILTVMVTVAAFPAYAAAAYANDREAAEAGKVMRVGAEGGENTKYFAANEMTAALQGAKDATLSVFKSFINVNTPAITNNLVLEGVKTVEPDGVTISDTTDYFLYCCAPNLTLEFKDINFSLYRGFNCGRSTSNQFTPNLDLTFTNVNATVSEGYFLYLQYTTTDAYPNGTGKVTLDHTVITSNSGYGSIIQTSDNNGSWTIDLKNGSKLIHNGGMGHNAGDSSLINLYSKATSTVNLGAGCELINNRTTNSSYHNTYPTLYRGALISINQVGTMVINLAKDSVMELRTGTLKNREAFIDIIQATAKLTVNDEGCQYKLSQAAAANASATVMHPVHQMGDGMILAGMYSVNGGEAYVTGSYADPSASGEVILRAVGYRTGYDRNDGNGCDGDIYNLAGAAIRLTEPYGVRFSARITSEFYHMLQKADPNVEVGFAILPASRIADGQFDVSLVTVKNCSKAEKFAVEDENGFYEFRTAVYIDGDSLLEHADKTAFETELAATAYFKVNGTIYLAAYDASYSALSLYDVAVCYYEDPVNGSTQNETVNHILTQCGYFAENEGGESA